jgi:hypothetical protein
LAALAAVGCQTHLAHGDAHADESAEVPDTIASSLRPLASASDAQAMLALARERDYAIRGEAVLVDAQTRHLEADDRALFERDGLRVQAFSVKYQRVGVAVAAPAALRGLGRLPPVRRVEPNYGATSGG